MAKANLKLPNGTSVHIEGTSDEVTRILTTLSNGEGNAGKGGRRSRPRRQKPPLGSGPKNRKRTGPVGLIIDLAMDNFFKTRKRLPEIQKKLEEQGHIYAQTSLSPAVLGLTKKKILRRLKEGKGWTYVRGSAAI